MIKKKPGQITCYLNDKDMKAIEKIAKALKTSKSHVARLAFGSFILSHERDPFTVRREHRTRNV